MSRTFDGFRARISLVLIITSGLGGIAFTLQMHIRIFAIVVIIFARRSTLSYWHFLGPLPNISFLFPLQPKYTILVSRLAVLRPSVHWGIASGMRDA